MTAIIEDIDIDWTTIIDFESDLACEAGTNPYHDDCDNPVEWRITTSCCGRSLLVCDPHNQADLDLVEKEGNIMATCIFCNSIVRFGDIVFSRVRI